MKEYYVRATSDLFTEDGIKWTDGEVYRVRETHNELILEADNSEIHYVIRVKDQVLENFEIIDDGGLV